MQTEKVDPKRIEELLAQRFDAIVPEGFHVFFADAGPRPEIAPGMLRFGFEGNPGYPWFGGSGFRITESLNHGDTMEQRFAWCAERALEALQNYVDEKSREPWPGQRDGMLHMWFGDADNPVLECEPIDLSLLEDGEDDFAEQTDSGD